MGQQLINISLAPYRSCISPNAGMVVANCIGNSGYKKGLLDFFLDFFWRNDLNFVTAHQLPRGGKSSLFFLGILLGHVIHIVLLLVSLPQVMFFYWWSHDFYVTYRWYDLSTNLKGISKNVHHMLLQNVKTNHALLWCRNLVEMLKILIACRWGYLILSTVLMNRYDSELWLLVL